MTISPDLWVITFYLFHHVKVVGIFFDMCSYVRSKLNNTSTQCLKDITLKLGRPRARLYTIAPHPEFKKEYQLYYLNPIRSFWLFLNMYILWLQRKIIVLWTLTGLLRGVLNRPVKIFCTDFAHFYDVLFRFYHVIMFEWGLQSI